MNKNLEFLYEELGSCAWDLENTARWKTRQAATEVEVANRLRSLQNVVIKIEQLMSGAEASEPVN